ncbi:hypothetical protein XOC_3105 [Xanthomonas oryzae pv. oryzicola BLS256]|uniref:Uncharacterized protein n=1 Tax=Xanthomonas oryzae pv. oryzicola (strain BLS256) TaxID=383407 RepID=G7TA18_XANOB|nr:hypothetical protein XOC_3105 [Xanthomonas oryzae pv. oryzicola BLS256]QEO96686.1 hypothetical protein XOCgx_1693 [Xanthomonas oryzae pv. oryzicola]
MYTRAVTQGLLLRGGQLCCRLVSAGPSPCHTLVLLPCTHHCPASLAPACLGACPLP